LEKSYARDQGTDFRNAPHARIRESDRELCNNSSLAQRYLDECEQIQNSFVLDIAGPLIGTDDASTQELEAMAADLFRWQEAFDSMPATEQGSESYRVAQECLRILKRNYVALYRKNELENLPAQETATVS